MEFVCEKDNKFKILTLSEALSDIINHIINNEDSLEEQKKFKDNISKGCAYSYDGVTFNVLDDSYIEEKWKELEDVTFNESPTKDLILNSDWFIFEKGTDKDNIHKWFNENHTKGLMNGLILKDDKEGNNEKLIIPVETIYNTEKNLNIKSSKEVENLFDELQGYLNYVCEFSIDGEDDVLTSTEISYITGDIVFIDESNNKKIIKYNKRKRYGFDCEKLMSYLQQ